MIFFTATVVALPALFTMLGEPDPADIYLVLELWNFGGIAEAMTRAGAQELGPERPPLARMVWADPAALQVLVQTGLWVVPASALSEMCGIDLGADT